jgi:hypothetical protein
MEEKDRTGPSKTTRGKKKSRESTLPPISSSSDSPSESSTDPISISKIPMYASKDAHLTLQE